MPSNSFSRNVCAPSLVDYAILAQRQTLFSLQRCTTKYAFDFSVRDPDGAGRTFPQYATSGQPNEAFTVSNQTSWLQGSLNSGKVRFAGFAGDMDEEWNVYRVAPFRSFTTRSVTVNMKAIERIVQASDPGASCSPFGAYQDVLHEIAGIIPSKADRVFLTMRAFHYPPTLTLQNGSSASIMYAVPLTATLGSVLRDFCMSVKLIDRGAVPQSYVAVRATFDFSAARHDPSLAKAYVVELELDRPLYELQEVLPQLQPVVKDSPDCVPTLCTIDIVPRSHLDDTALHYGGVDTRSARRSWLPGSLPGRCNACDFVNEPEAEVCEVCGNNIADICGHCGASPAPIRCHQCDRVRYCNEACQGRDRMRHRPLCRELRNRNRSADRRTRYNTPPGADVLTGGDFDPSTTD